MTLLTRTRAAGLLAISLLMLTANAAAAVTFNGDGSGFVNKGEVRTTIGWTNAQLQANAALVDFRRLDLTTDVWTVGCIDTASGDELIAGTYTNEVGTLTNYDTTPRMPNGKVTGFGLQPGAVENILEDNSFLWVCPDGTTGFSRVTSTQTDALEVTGGAGWVVLHSF